jgi:glycosyltransferase involved in cell wall biosynthesis
MRRIEVKVVIAAVTAPKQMNGVARHAANLAGALLQTSLVSKIHFVAGIWQKEMFRQICELRDSRLHMHFVNLADANLSRLAWYYRELPYIATQLEADIVHFACPVPIRAGAFRCGTVVTLHDLYPFDIPQNFGRFSRFVTRTLMQRCIKRADAIACVSEATRSRLEKWFPAEAQKAITIPNVVEQDQSPRLDRFALIPDDRTFILCVAQHRSNKNVPLAIRIFGRVLRKRLISCTSRLVVVGIEGPATRAIHAQIKELNLQQNVLLLSGLSDAELQWCYRHCRLLLAPSRTEGFGLPVAEALLAGCPVVCSEIPAFREVAGDKCHYVSWGERILDKYGDAIRSVLEAPRPQPVALPDFSSRVIGQRYMDLYQTLSCCGVSEFWYATATRS